MIKILAATITVVATASLLAAPTAEASKAVSATAHGPRTHGKMLVIGDSITDRYNDVAGSPAQGWWSFLADAIDEVPVLAAESGSGFQMRYHCKSSIYIERLDQVAKTGPTSIFVEGGRNDYRRCTKLGNTVTASRHDTDVAIRDFMHALLDTVKESGIDPGHVYVLTPWGATLHDKGKWIRADVERYASSRGFHWLSTHYIADKHTSDGTHPTRSGSKDIYNDVARHTVIRNIIAGL